jgi:protein-tyrosine-phosphatase
MIPRLLGLFVLIGALVVAETSISGRSEPPATILFLCPHGGAKSVIAASYFNRLTKERGLPLAGIAAATEEPSDRVPPPVVALLAQEGIDVSKYRPRRVERDDVARALRIVAIDCDLSKTDSGSFSVERWDDVPKVSEDLPGATRAIRRHLEKLVQEIAEMQSNRSASLNEFDHPNDWPSPSVRTCIPP